MKAQRLQAEFARKREAELMRIEKSAAVNRYFDHWGKVTTRFENWTSPKYYEQAEENRRLAETKKQEAIEAEHRKEQQRDQRCQENAIYEAELNKLRKKKMPKRIQTNVLEQIDKNLKSEQRRRLDLESKLYGRWRHGVNDEHLLYDSKSDNQVLAKLNWLDKQVEEQMKREEEEKQAEKVKLQQLEEARKREESLRDRHKIRESEIKDLKELQERHLAEMRDRDVANDSLKAEENHLREAIDKLEGELALLHHQMQASNLPVSVPHNIKRVKMIMKSRSQDFRNDLKSDVDLLFRLRKYCDKDALQQLIDKFEEQTDFENENQSKIDCMYESEAKHNLLRWEEAWKDIATKRRNQLFHLINSQKASASAKLSDNLQQQQNLIEVRSAHLSSIEQSNGKLKMLIQEQEDYSLSDLNSNRPAEVEPSTPLQHSHRDAAYNSSSSGKDSVQKIIQDFSHFYTTETDGISSKKSPATMPNPDLLAATTAPKFGRKRVAWT